VACQAHITGWTTINNDGGTTTNSITDMGNSTIIGGAEGYQALALFPTTTLANGQYVELSATFQALGRTPSAAADLQRLRDQIRVALLRAPAADPLQAQNLTGYILEHRSEVREIRNPIGAPATNQSPFVSARSSPLGTFSTAADPQFGSGTGNMNYTETDLVVGVDITMNMTFRITRDGDNLDITGSIAGTPAVMNTAAGQPAGDGVFLEQFSQLDYNPAINLNDVAGTDNFDFKFNRIGFLIGGNIDLEVGPFPGDYNDDKVVDTADYVVWRDNNNTAATLPNDSTPGVDDTDYPIWAGNFGRKLGTIVLTNVTINTTATQGSGLSAGVVPEPACIGLLTLCAAAAGIARIRRRSFSPR
jgi:hypothetical protein